MRQITYEHRQKIKQYEGCVLYAYDDADASQPKKFIQPGMPVRGTLTIGFGHTGPDVVPGLRIDASQADALLDRDLDPCEAAVERLVKVKLTDGQFAALVSFVFNVGVGAFTQSSLLRRLNAGEYDAVPAELQRWRFTQINGRKVESIGLVNRRAAEAGLWAQGAFVSTNTIEAAPTPAPAGKTEVIAGTVGGGTAIATGGASVIDAVSRAGSEAERASWLAQNGTTIGIVCAAIVLICGGLAVYMMLRRRH